MHSAVVCGSDDRERNDRRNTDRREESWSVNPLHCAKLVGLWVCFGLIYAGLARLALLLWTSGGISLFWPPNGFSIVVLLRSPLFHWPPIMFCLMGGFLLAVLTPDISQPVGMSLGIMLANIIELLVATVPLLIFRPEFRGPVEDIVTSINLLWLGLFALLGPFVASFFGAWSVVHRYSDVNYRDTVAAWIAGDSVGNILTAWSGFVYLKYYARLKESSPSVIWSEGTRQLRQKRGVVLTKILELLFFVAFTVAVSKVSNHNTYYSFLLTLFFPLCVWVALRFHECVLVTLLLLMTITLGISSTYTVIPNTELFPHVININLYLAMTIMCSCYISASGREAKALLKERERLVEAAVERCNELSKSKEAIETMQKEALLFVYMSHELKTPLSIIIGFCTELYEESGLAPHSKQGLKHILNMAEELLQLTNSMLDMMRLKSASASLNMAPLDLHELFANVCGKLGLYGRYSGVDVVSNLSPSVPRFIIGDGMRISEIIFNLAGNGIKFSNAHIQASAGTSQDTDTTSEKEKKPVVIIELNAAPLVKPPKLELNSSSTHTRRSFATAPVSASLPLSTTSTLNTSSRRSMDDLTRSVTRRSVLGTQKLELRVTDFGRGIPKEAQSTIFDVFQRVGTSNEQASTPGTGLGLAIVKELITKMGGQIGVESEVGKGSTFHVTFEAQVVDGGEYECRPASAASAFSAAASPEKPMRAQQNGAVAESTSLHVLVVEDMILNQKLLTSMLNKDGHTYEVTNNGEEALQLAASKREGKPLFDVLIVDLYMDVCDGETFLRERLTRPCIPDYFRALPVIIASADVRPEQLERLNELTPITLLNKPYRLPELRALFRNINKTKTAPATSTLDDTLTTASTYSNENSGLSMENLPACEDLV